MKCKCQTLYVLCFLLGCFARLPAEFSSAVDYLSLKFAISAIPLKLNILMSVSYDTFCLMYMVVNVKLFFIFITGKL